MALHLNTPLIRSDAWRATLAAEVWLKLDALQPPGSFKLRGVGLACETRAQQGATRLVSSSGGNAGLAVAYAGRALGLPVCVVVPQTASVRARELLLALGAEVVVVGASWQEAHAHAQQGLGPGDAFIHPFDDPLLWQGHASLVHEVAEAGLVPDAVVVAVGGGGLLCGVAQGMAEVGWHTVPILAVETEGSASLRAALDAGGPVELPAITSIATSLGAKRVCDRALAWAAERPIHSLVVSDAQAVDACLFLLNEHRLLVEPACGAALAALSLPTNWNLPPVQRLLVVVCGGATATLDQLLAWQVGFKQA